MATRQPSRTGTPRHVFGAVLRHYRERADLSRSDLAARIHKSVSLIESIERGERVATQDVISDLEGVAELGADGTLLVLREQFKDSLNYQAYPAWFQDWAYKEPEAVALRWWEPLVVPGLLQTEDYARAIFRTRLKTTKDEINELVEARIGRQAILARDDPPMLWVLLDEGVLRRPIGGPRVVFEQLARLAETREHPAIVVQVIPARVAAHEGLKGAFAMADFDDAPSLGYEETATRGRVVDVPDDVASLDLTWNTLRSEALPRAASLDLIEEAAEQWKSAA